MPRRKQAPTKLETPKAKKNKPVEEEIQPEAEVAEVEDEIDDQENNKIKLSLPEESGELLICGGANWSLNGRKKVRKGDEKYEKVGRNLWKPHRYTCMNGIKVKRVITGPLSSHNLLIDESGKVYSWGRNECGQLGHGDRSRYDTPKPIHALEKTMIVNAATGRNHTLCLTENGTVYAFGDNIQGQLGLGNSCATFVVTPTRIKYKGNPIVSVACGAEFSILLDCEGFVWSFGSPEYGQLGNNTDGKYFASANKMGLDTVKTAFRIPVWIEKTKDGQAVPCLDVKITNVACGANHCVALDAKKRVFTWGFGGYGRLGHSEQKDEYRPRLVQSFDRPGRGAMQIWAGATYCMALNEMGSTFFWGLQGNNASRECTMYPKPFADLQGWKVRSIGCGNKHCVVAADDKVIVWGVQTSSGELGLGEKRKSSANPDFMKSAENCYIYRASCGFAHSLMIARTEKDEDQKALSELASYDPKPMP